jgi:hypothetical protein
MNSPDVSSQANFAPAVESRFQQLAEAAFNQTMTAIESNGVLPNIRVAQDKLGVLTDVVMCDVETVITGSQKYGYNPQPIKQYRLSIHERSLTTGRTETNSKETSEFNWANTRARLLERAELATPHAVVRSLAKAASTVEDIEAVIDITLSKRFQNAAFKYAQTDQDGVPSAYGVIISNNLAAWYADSLLGDTSKMAAAQARLLARVVEPSTRSTAHTFVTGVDMAFGRTLHTLLTSKLLPLNNDISPKIVAFLRPFEELRLLSVPRLSAGILNNVVTVAQAPIAELLLDRLSQESPVTTGHEVKRNANFAKGVIQNLLARYAEDPERHAGNTAIIARRLFPDVARTGSLSRSGLITLSNAITSEKNKGLPPEQAEEPFQLNRKGIVGEALVRVLRITTANDVSHDIYDKHRKEDAVFGRIISLLLEADVKPASSGDEKT